MASNSVTSLGTFVTSLDEDIEFLKMLPIQIQFYILYNAPINLSSRSVVTLWRQVESLATPERFIRAMHREIINS